MEAKKKAIIRDILHYDRTELITLNLFWIGFIIYTVSWTLSASKQMNYVMCQMLQMLGLMIFIPAFIRLVRFRFNNEYQKILFIVFMAWAVTIFVRGLPDLESDTLKATIFNPWFGGFLYFAPLVMLLPKKLIYFKKIFDVIIILAVFYIIYDLRFISDLMNPDIESELSRDIVEYFTKTLALPVIFILLTYTYHSKPKILFAIVILLVAIFFSIVRARRGMLIMAVGPLLIVYYFYMINSKNKIAAISLSLLGICVLAVGAILFFSNNPIDIFENLEERGTGDTRSGVEENFYKSMKGFDWVIGRGMLGEYYSPYPGGNYRGTIETDYLNMILKGGFINLILLLLILIPAMFNGIFRSKNMLSKAAGFWIFIWLLSTYPATVQVFTLYYILVWVSVGICYSRTIRNIPDRVFKIYFQT